jgi:hypothetical protein
MFKEAQASGKCLYSLPFYVNTLRINLGEGSKTNNAAFVRSVEGKQRNTSYKCLLAMTGRSEVVLISDNQLINLGSYLSVISALL